MIGARAKAGAALLLLAAGCRAPQARTPVGPMDPATRARVARGERLRSEGDEDAALAALNEALARAPLCVEAHRAIQEIRIGRLEKGALLAEYGALLAARPDRAEARYLFARLLAEPRRQREALEEAVAIDPGFAFGIYGLATNLRSAGDEGKAEALYRKAIAADATRPEFRLALVDLLLGSDRLREASRAARAGGEAFPEDGRFPLLAAIAALRAGSRRAVEHGRTAVALAPFDAGAWDTLRDALERHGTEGDLRRARLAARAAADAPKPPEAETERRALLGWIEMRLGDAFAAASELEAAAALGSPDARLRRDLGRARFATGRFADAFEGWTAGIPAVAPGGTPRDPARRRAALGEACRAAERAPRDAETLRRLARALRDAGFPEEASLTAGRLRAASAGDPEATAIAASVAREAAFVEVVGERLRELAAAKEGTLRGFLAEVSALAEATLGEDVAKGSRIRSYFPLGAIVDPAGPGIPRWFAERNRFALFGRKTFAPPEGIVLRILDRRPLDALLLGRPVRGEVVLGEARALTPSASASAGELAGAAVFDGYFVDLDVVRERAAAVERSLARCAPRREAVFADPLPRISAPAERRSLDESLGLEEKLLLRAAARREGDWTARLLRIVELHEQGHLADAGALLPVRSHVPRAIAFLARAVARGESVESVLEERAELAALAASDEPDVVLAGVVAASRVPGSKEPHAQGYRRLLAGLLERLDDRSRVAPWTGHDADANLLQQLDRVPLAVLREEAAALAAERGVRVAEGAESPAALLGSGGVR